MVRLGKIGELEINGESFRHPISVFHRERADDVAGARHQVVVEFGYAQPGLLPVLNEQPPQLLDDIEKRFALLFH